MVWSQNKRTLSLDIYVRLSFDIFCCYFHFKPFSETRKERKRERKDSQMCKHRERESAVEPTIAPVRSPSSSPPCDDECFVHPNTTEIAHQHPSTGEIYPHPRAPIPPPWASIHMTHPCPISLFLDLPLPFPHLSITLSSLFSPFDRDFGVNKCFVLIFVWFCFYFCLF